MKKAASIGLLALSLAHQARASDTCARITNVTGSSCETLSYDVDLSACEDKVGKGKPRVQCADDRARVTFHSESHGYTALVQIKTDGWGKKSWALSEVGVSEVGPKRSTKTVVTEAPAPAREPAQANPSNEASAEKPATPAMAEAATTPTAPNAVSSSLEVNGYLDLYYQNNFNGRRENSGLRVFGTRNNVIQLNVAELTLKRKQGNVGFRLDIAAGETVDGLDPTPPIPVPTPTTGNPNPVVNTADEPTRMFTQAFVTWTPDAVPGLTISAGKMYTHVGLELTRAQDNWNYTRSMLFNYGGPFWHQGLSIGYQIVPEALSGTLFLYDSWDGRLATEQNRSPALGANLSFTGIKGLTANYNYIGGPESADSRSRREAHEVNATYAITDSFAMAFDVLLGSQEIATALEDRATWKAFAVYAKYGLFTWLNLVARYEYYDDSDKGYTIAGGYAGPAANQSDWVIIQSITLGANFDLGDGLETRLEYRNDHADRDYTLFGDRNGNPTKTQETANIAILFHF